MWESIWPYLANDCVKGLLVAASSLGMRWLAPKAQYLLGRLRAGEVNPDRSKLRPLVQRRLVAILVTDVAGYSRLTGADEEGTHGRFMAHRYEVIEPTIRNYRGRIVKNTGDGALAEFGSVVNAVRCAIEVQLIMAGRNAGVPDDRRVEFRIGINLGDVIVEADDIYGDGVNVAVRLEGLAAPGEICVSADAWRCVRGIVPVQVIDLGQQRLKNIAEPAYVYAIRPT
jgi:adenylate cyclase